MSDDQASGIEMHDDVIRTIIEETVNRAAALMRVPRVMPGTVVSASSGAENVSVLIDGDTAPIETTSVIGIVNPNQRVMVLFYPPSGSVIFGYKYGT